MKSLFLMLYRNCSLDYKQSPMTATTYLEGKAEEVIKHLNNGHATLTAGISNLGPQQSKLKLGDSIDSSFKGITLITAKGLATMLNDTTTLEGLTFIHMTIEVETRPTYTGTW